MKSLDWTQKLKLKQKRNRKTNYKLILNFLIYFILGIKKNFRAKPNKNTMKTE